MLTPAPKGIPDRYEIALDAPLSAGGVVLEKLVLREPTGFEMRTIRAARVVDLEIVAVATIAGAPKDLIEQLPGSKLYEADAYIWSWVSDEGLPDDGLPPKLVIPLAKPSQNGDHAITELELREPTAVQYRAIFAETTIVNRQILAVATVTGLPESVVGVIGARALTRAENYLLGFIAAGRRRIGGE